MAGVRRYNAKRTLKTKWGLRRWQKIVIQRDAVPFSKQTRRRGLELTKAVHVSFNTESSRKRQRECARGTEKRGKKSTKRVAEDRRADVMS